MDLDFHYSRDERLSMAAAPRTGANQSFFRRYRSLLIVLADIVVLLVIGFIALRFLGPPPRSARAGDYSASLRGLQYGEVIFATVTVRRVAGDSRRDEPGERAFVRFALKRNASEAESFFDSAPLPRAKGEEVVLQAALPFEETGDRLWAELGLGEHTVRLSLPRSAW